MDPHKLRLAPHDGSGMDPERWLLAHRARHERERMARMRIRIILLAICLASLALIVFAQGALKTY